MKEIKLFVDFEFTSLSPDAQVISLGIVSEDIMNPDNLAKEWLDSDNPYMPFANELIGRLSKSFYAEFTDFDINRCDDWVKENVVGKLEFYPDSHDGCTEYCMENWDMCKDTKGVIIKLKSWLSQFSDYQIQIVVDCGTWDWYHFLQLVAEWDEVPAQLIIDTAMIPCDMTIEDFVNTWKEQGPIFVSKLPEPKYINIGGKIGLPKLPSNISPVPQDLNDFIANKMGISVKEAFDINREELALGHHSEGLMKRMKILDNVAENELARNPIEGNKHNSLWDAKVIKAIYEKLM